MIGVDTNVLIRLLTNDDPTQTQRARKYVAARCTPESPAFVSREVLLETVWVLESAYAYDRHDVAAAVEAVLETADLRVEASDCARGAMRAYRVGADFGDAFIAAVNQCAGCKTTLTFDKSAAARLSHFTLL